MRFLGRLSTAVMCVSGLGCGEKNASDKAVPEPAASATATREAASAKAPAPFGIDVDDIPVRPKIPVGHPQVRFKEAQEDCGIVHQYVNGETGRVLLVETIGGGVGWLDFDSDGRWDLFANQGGDPTSKDYAAQPLDELFRCLDGQQFESVARSARIVEPFYSQAVSIGDYDNDGFDDIYVSNVGANTMWHNCGDGTFEEVSQLSGVADPRWSVSAAWCDLDRDGDLDLYVCNYVVYDPFDPVPCKDPQGNDALCNPGTLNPWPDAYYVNQGDGSFVESSQMLGLAGPDNRALGVAIADFSGDGWSDVYVANDTTANFLFINDGTGHFRDRASELGCAVDREGATQASMGVAVGDYDRNGWLDIFVTNYYEESNTLYANFGAQGFQDRTALEGLHAPTLAVLGFGTLFEDFDQDRRMELFVANGHVNNARSNPVLKMPAQLFGFGESFWSLLNESAGDYFTKLRLGRGVATADFDDDGDADLAVLNQNDSLALLRNESLRGNWLQLRFRGRASNRRGIGCRVLLTQGDQRLMRELCGGTSYASSIQPALVFGLGNITEPVDLEVRWPSGRIQLLKRVSVNQTLDLLEPVD